MPRYTIVATYAEHSWDDDADDFEVYAEREHVLGFTPTMFHVFKNTCDRYGCTEMFGREDGYISLRSPEDPTGVNDKHHIVSLECHDGVLDFGALEAIFGRELPDPGQWLRDLLHGAH